MDLRHQLRFEEQIVQILQRGKRRRFGPLEEARPRLADRLRRLRAEKTAERLCREWNIEVYLY